MNRDFNGLMNDPTCGGLANTLGDYNAAVNAAREKSIAEMAQGLSDAVVDLLCELRAMRDGMLGCRPTEGENAGIRGDGFMELMKQICGDVQEARRLLTIIRQAVGV
ncbi:MAG: hypothetical protein IKK78_00040 [Oscillospiraceae bacterium]|nr:hypothetical protein [Oscillospiraceae bacterium]